MKSGSKHASRMPGARRWACRPNLETLEIRAQPGSLLFSGLSAGLLGSGLDPGAAPPDSGSDLSLLSIRWLDEQTTNALPAVPLTGGSASAAPGQVGTVSASLPSSAWADLGATAQPNAAHVAPVGSLAAPANAVTLQNPTAAPAHASAGDLHPAVVAGSIGPSVAPTVTPIEAVLSTTDAGSWSVETINGIRPLVSTQWSSFFGGPGPKNRIVEASYVNAANGILVGGYTQDPNDATKTDATVGLISRDGTTATIARYTNPNFQAGAEGKVQSVAATTNVQGNITAIYVGGYQTTGGGNNTPKAFVASLGPNLNNLTVNWRRTPAPNVVAPSNCTGIALNAAGTDLYVTGYVGNNAFAGDLNTNDGTTHNYLVTIAGPAGTTVRARGIGVDSTGKADIALRTVGMVAANNPNPAWVQVAANGAVGAIHTLTSTGDTTEIGDPTFQAGLNAVTVDGAGNAYYAGTSYGSLGANDTFSFQILEKVAPDGNTILYMNNGVPVSWHWYLLDANGNHTFNWGAFANKIRGDHQVTATTEDDGSQALGTHGEIFFAVGPNGDTSTDFGDAGLSGSNDDYGYALAQDSFNNAVFYMGGKTNSPDFGTTPGAFQANFRGNAPADDNGWIASLSAPNA